MQFLSIPLVASLLLRPVFEILPVFPYLERMNRVAVGIIVKDGQLLACQRRRNGRYPLKWEFPGGKIERGETAREALVRELREELSINTLVEKEFFRQEWTYPESVARSPSGRGVLSINLCPDSFAPGGTGPSRRILAISPAISSGDLSPVLMQKSAARR